jgi:SAM-dependent methyltransferase
MISFFKNHIEKSSHRNELERLLKRALPKLVGSILDVGSRNRRYDYLMKETPTAIDRVEDKERGVFYGDILNIPFPEESFDNVVSFEVLEYVNDPEKAVSELSRVTKVGGKVLVSVPFLVRSHDDQMRYTEHYLRTLFSKYFQTFHIQTIGNFYTIILDIFWSRAKKNSWKPLRYFYLVLLLPLFALIPFSRLSTDKNYTSGFLITASK